MDYSKMNFPEYLSEEDVLSNRERKSNKLKKPKHILGPDKNREGQAIAEVEFMRRYGRKGSTEEIRDYGKRITKGHERPISSVYDSQTSPFAIREAMLREMPRDERELEILIDTEGNVSIMIGNSSCKLNSRNLELELEKVLTMLN